MTVLQGLKLNAERKPQVDIEKNIQNIEVSMRSMMSLMNDFTSSAVKNPPSRSLARAMPATMHHHRPSSNQVISRQSMTVPIAAPSQDSGVSNGLLTHVWPKSRMLFAIVSNMAKRG